jgi:MFS superfamily sulfate permease-like transporter
MVGLLTIATIFGWGSFAPKSLRIIPALLAAEVVIFVVTVVTIVLTDLLKGVVLGLVLSLIKLLYAFSHLVIRIAEKPEERRTDLYLAGSATLIRLPTLASTLENLKPNTHVHVHIDELDYIDHACIDLLTSWDRQHKASGGSLEIEWEGLTEKYKKRSSASFKAAREAARNGV